MLLRLCDILHLKLSQGDRVDLVSFSGNYRKWRRDLESILAWRKIILLCLSQEINLPCVPAATETIRLQAKIYKNHNDQTKLPENNLSSDP